MPTSEETGAGQNQLDQYMAQSEEGASTMRRAREDDLQDLTCFIKSEMDKRKKAKALKEAKEHNLAVVQKLGAKQVEAIEALHEAIKVPSVNVAMDKVKKEIHTTLRSMLESLDSQEVARAKSSIEHLEKKAKETEATLEQERDDTRKQISTLQTHSTELQEKIKSLELRQLQSSESIETAQARIMELENETEQANNAKSRLETEVGQLHQEINDLRSAHALADSGEATRLRAIDKDHQLCPTKLQAALNQWSQSEAARQSAVTAHADCVDAKEAARLSRVDEEHQSCAARLHAVSEDLTQSEAARAAAVAAHADCAKECEDCQELAVALESLEREVKEIDRSLQ